MLAHTHTHTYAGRYVKIGGASKDIGGGSSVFFQGRDFPGEVDGEIPL